MANKLKFPEGFLWGAAASAYQTEGGNSHCDWWAWEHSARREDCLRKEGKDPSDYQSGIACDFWNRYDEDFALAQHLSHNAIRIGIEWSRIQPEEGVLDEAALEHYEKILQSAKYHGLKVFLTLHHYTLPVWFMKKGGFTKKENITYFLHYARNAAKRFSQYADFWVTINEPILYAAQSYWMGIHPPQVKSFHTAKQVTDNLIQSHNLLAEYIQQHLRQPVSMAFNLSDLQPSGLLGGLAAGLADYATNEYVLRRTIGRCDYIGVNYYFHHHIGLLGIRKHSHSQHYRTDRGWGIHPEGIERILLRLRKYKKPIYILENGLADNKDDKREKFIKDHLFYVHQAIGKGVDVKGYLYWSLTDNFEWEEGFWPRFGLIEIDREDLLRRKVRYSATKFAEICRNNYLEV
ncbi:MAG: family 1 glycosylhydrolase [Patescibacteria group bacterium]|nr:family 1 glycosylhydrolase [Patescibacteria group bacterium]